MSIRSIFVYGALALATQPLFAQPKPTTGPSVAPDYSSRILTPPAPKTPRINGATVYGERPGRPFLYTIPATGERPMSFSVDGLPDGLTLDEKTGQITGSVKEAGEHEVTLHAKNSLGENSKKLKIVIGDKIALTPALGWNSWNCWAGAVDQEKVLHSARAFVDAGLINHGWTYINIDDTWQGKRDEKTKGLLGNEKFPDLKGLCDQVHAMGLKAGIYSTPWMTSYAGFPGSSADNEDGSWTKPTEGKGGRRFGKYPFIENDAKQWAAYGFDYLKYDWNPNEEPEIRAMHDALLASGRDIVYSLSNALPFKNAQIATGLANSWRTTGDIRDTWESMASIGFSQNRWAPFAAPGHWNDPDMLVVGWVGWGPQLHYSKLTADEQFTHISLWSLLSAPLLIGCDMDRLDPFTISLLTNDEVLAIDQDALGKQATLVATQGDDVVVRRNNKPNTKPQSFPAGQVWLKELEDGSRAAGFFNLSDKPMKVKADFAALKLDGKQVVRDVWRQKDLGTVGNSYEAEVAPHGVVLVKFTAEKK
jgi:alpha-galactosidase